MPTTGARMAAWVEGSGFRAVPLDGGRSCLAALARERPVAVILDLGLRGLGGFATLDFIRTVEPDLPVVALAGPGDRGRAADLLERGADELLLKPAGQVHLSRALAAVLRPSPLADVA